MNEPSLLLKQKPVESLVLKKKKKKTRNLLHNIITLFAQNSEDSFVIVSWDNSNKLFQSRFRVLCSPLLDEDDNSLLVQMQKLYIC